MRLNIAAGRSNPNGFWFWFKPLIEFATYSTKNRIECYPDNVVRVIWFVLFNTYYFSFDISVAAHRVMSEAELNNLLDE